MTLTQIWFLIILGVVILYVVGALKKKSQQAAMRDYAAEYVEKNPTAKQYKRSGITSVSEYADKYPEIAKGTDTIEAGWEDLVFLDTETTGLDHSAEIVEIAIVDHDSIVLLESFVKPKNKIPADATAIHGITNEMVKNAPTLKQLTPKIRAAVRGKILAIYNSEYDMQYLPDLGG